MTEIEAHENEIEMLQDQHHQIAMHYDNLPDVSEVSEKQLQLENQMEELESDIQYHLDEIKKLKR